MQRCEGSLIALPRDKVVFGDDSLTALWLNISVSTLQWMFLVIPVITDSRPAPVISYFALLLCLHRKLNYELCEE